MKIRGPKVRSLVVAGLIVAVSGVLALNAVAGPPSQQSSSSSGSSIETNSLLPLLDCPLTDSTLGESNLFSDQNNAKATAFEALTTYLDYFYADYSFNLANFTAVNSSATIVDYVWLNAGSALLAVRVVKGDAGWGTSQAASCGESAANALSELIA